MKFILIHANGEILWLPGKKTMKVAAKECHFIGILWVNVG
jgi:hypothetical protein